MAALLLRRNETVSRRTLIAEVWSADAEVFELLELEERKRGVLFTYIARLRAALEPVAAAMGEDALLFTEDPHQHRHSPPAVSLAVRGEAK